MKQDKPKWKSDIPLTEGQLRSKRDEFWDTAPAFEGRKEIWDALKVAAQAAESNDYELAQAIIDGACISLPNGKCECKSWKCSKSVRFLKNCKSVRNATFLMNIHMYVHSTVHFEVMFYI